MPQQIIRRVGVIGLGKMGAPIVRHLVNGGCQVLGFDVSPVAMEAGRNHGATMMDSPQDVAAGSDLVIILTAFESQVEDVLFGPRGIAASRRKGLIIGIGATIAPAAMRSFASRLGEEGMIALDIPTCRGERQAEAGTLLLVGGGDKEAFELCRPAFATFASDISYLGEVGAGQVGKMVNNLILWACITANHEGLALGEKLGVERDAMREMLLLSSGQNWALENNVANLPAPWAEKDMMIVLKEADDARISVPLCGVVKEVMKGIKLARGDW